MKNLKIILVTALTLFLFSGTCFSQAKCIFKEAGFTQLFNGEDLSGWKTPSRSSQVHHADQRGTGIIALERRHTRRQNRSDLREDHDFRGRLSCRICFISHPATLPERACPTSLLLGVCPERPVLEPSERSHDRWGTTSVQR